MSGMILWIPFILEDSGDTNIKERQNKQSYYSLFYQLHNTHIHILLNALYHNYGKILGNKTNFYTHSLSFSLSLSSGSIQSIDPFRIILWVNICSETLQHTTNHLATAPPPPILIAEYIAVHKYFGCWWNL